MAEDKYTTIGTASFEGVVGRITACVNGKRRISIAVHENQKDAFGQIRETTEWVTAYTTPDVADAVDAKYSKGDHVKATGLLSVREVPDQPTWGGKELQLDELELLRKKGARTCKV